MAARVFLEEANTRVPGINGRRQAVISRLKPQVESGWEHWRKQMSGI